ncbi:hypothetical protein DM43_6359 [Burkholderia cepacia]|uniref:Uncharacterized protein n=1 Tax=Burkholderia cepacia TaxID=292 RepID=A0AA88ZEJ8_BURCE|nr:hypothetical protein DM43_6359 [Burkholderia cepacia]
MIPLFTVYRSTKRRRSRRSAANSSNVSNQPLRRARTCPPGYPHHTLSNVTARRNRPAPPRARFDATCVPLRFFRAGSSAHAPRSAPTSRRARRMPTAFHPFAHARVRSGRRTGVGPYRRNMSLATGSRRQALRSAVVLRYLRLSFAFTRIPTRCIRSRPPSPNPGRSSTRGRRRARIRRSFPLLSHRRPSALRRPRRRHASADRPASVFVFHSPRWLQVRAS